MLEWLKHIKAWRQSDAPTPPTNGGRVMRARFDSAATTDENRRHWANADGLSPNASINSEVRRTLRNRARYEVANNSYAKGIVLTLANDTIGTGPRLQMLTEDAAANRTIEMAFAQWSEAVGLPAKLRTMRMAKADSGEAFAVLINNPAVQAAVQLDLRLIEADQVTTPLFNPLVPQPVDGIVFDALGNAMAYHVLRQHPGDGMIWSSSGLLFDRVPVSSMIHYFRADRPGQARGIPDITPALPLFAQLRRYTLAVIAAAETAADFAAVLYTDAPAQGEADPVEAMDLVELERRMATVLPGGWKLGQVAAEQPATTYGEFKKEILNEIARCLGMPFNIAAGNSSGYNYASGRLDHQTYFKSIRVEQDYIEAVILDRILNAWLNEAVLVEGLLPQFMRNGTPTHRGNKYSDTTQGTFGNFRGGHQWFWDGFEHVDPAKDANAQATRLSSNTTTLAHEYGRQGRDWESELRQRAKELALMKQLGLPVATNQPRGGADQADEPQEQETDDAQPVGDQD